MKITLFRGFRTSAVHHLIRRAWESEKELFIFCPPTLENLNFLDYLPQGDLNYQGDWSSLELRKERRHCAFEASPVLGVFTSGTMSGEHRLILYTKDNIRSSLKAIFSLFEMERARSIFCYPQTYHTFGLVLGHVASIEYSLDLLAVPDGRYTSAYHQSWLEQVDQGTITLGTPTHFIDLIKYVKQREVVPNASLSCIAGGASVSIKLWDSLKEILKIEAPSIGYGASEASPGICHLPPGKRPLEDNEIGYRLENIQILNVEEKSFSFKGRSVCYAIIDKNGLDFPQSIQIADIISKRDDNTWMFLGRGDSIMNRGGEKISLDFIERLILENAATECIACSLPSDRLGEELGILVTNTEAISGVKETLKRHLNHSFDTSVIMSIKRIPLNSSAKPDRRRARQLLLEYSNADKK